MQASVTGLGAQHPPDVALSTAPSASGMQPQLLVTSMPPLASTASLLPGQPSIVAHLPGSGVPSSAPIGISMPGQVGLVQGGPAQLSGVALSALPGMSFPGMSMAASSAMHHHGGYLVGTFTADVNVHLVVCCALVFALLGCVFHFSCW
jgi:hypothetical protein